MFEREATWLGDHLNALPVADISPLLNLGSSDRRFRERTQPYIDARVFAPQVARGVQVVHSDIKAQDGVDVVADVLSDAGVAALTAVRPRAVVCSNVHEHVPDPAELARRCVALLPAGGYLLVTVPHSYPYHFDPVDTLYRPDPDELCALHEGLAVVDRARVTDCTYRESLRRDPLRFFGDLAEQARALVRTRSGSHLRLRWWSRPYAVSCAVLRRPP